MKRSPDMTRSVVYACATLVIVVLFLIITTSRQIDHEVPRPLTEICKGELCSLPTSLHQGDQSLVCDSTNKGCYCSSKASGKQSRSVLESPVPCLSQATINNIEKFVFFIGYARSGHSIIGSMMDAHPNMIVPNEYNIFGKLRTNMTSWDKEVIFDELYRKSYCDATCGRRSEDAADHKAYTLSLNGSWQGKYTALKVIGDKKGGATAQMYGRSPLEFTKLYKRLSETLNIPFRVIHVVRNPYDMIATWVLIREGVHDQYASGKLSVTNKYDAGSKAMHGRTNYVFREVKGVQDMIPGLNLTVLEIHSADFIRDSKQTLRRVCTFLDLTCPEDYLQACYDKTFKSTSRSRDVLVWDEKLIEDIESRMKQYSFYRRYSFHSD